jgi:hypothetical protein
MAVALLLVDLPLVPAALLGAVLYLAMLAAVERAAFREDVELMVRIARRRAWG